MELAAEQYEELKAASERFLASDNFNYIDTKILMDRIFGADRSSDEAQKWATYWTELLDEYAKMRDGDAYKLPVLPRRAEDIVEMDVDTSNSSDTPPTATLSNDSLRSDREAERAERKANGNEHGKEKKDRGRSFDDLMAAVFIERQELNGKGEMKPVYYCLGCDNPVRNNNKKRNTSHMIGCRALQRDFPATWTRFKDDVQPSVEQVASGEAPAPPLRTKKRKIEDATEGRAPLPGITTPLGDDANGSPAASVQSSLDNMWGNSKITTVRQAIIDYLLLRLIVCCALAFSLCDNGFFRDFCNALCPGYSLPDRSNFVSYNLVVETENAMKQLQSLLTSFIHLTMSFDGWSSRRNDEIYTVHVSTPTRMSYLVAGIILTGLSTTGETICARLTEILVFYAAVRFSMIVSDTTGNVKKCRALICKKYPWILNCPDPAHQLNLLMKDLMVGSKKFPKILGFAQVMKIISQIVTYFSHSNYGKKHLKDKLKEQVDQRGLVSFGETRFSTFAEQSSSVSRCLPAMSQCFKEGLIAFDTKVTKPLQKYFVADSPAQLELRANLYNINMLLQPMARALKTLENSQVTISDVYNIWIGMGIGLSNVFIDPENPINKYHQETVDCYNRRYAIFMNDCTPGMFILAYLLDPVYYSDGAIRLALPPRVNFSKQTASPLVVYLISKAREMLQNEQKREQRGDKSEGDILVKQMISYMYREAPFDLPCKELSVRLAWWKSIAKDSNAYLLARLGIKLFSVVPSEMCDERTASKLTAMSTAKRNNLSADNLVRCAQLNQYWRYGFGSAEVNQHCQKVRLELPTPNRKPSDPIVAGIPSLRDLLNAESTSDSPADIDEDKLFNPPDPYGIKDYEAMQEDEEDSDFTPPPLVCRKANFPVFDIETYIDLKAPKLTARFAADQEKPKADVAAPKKAAKAPATQWSVDDAEWDADNWDA
ncbi:ribonuclease H-like domain-containing protein [Favolaschia claudopus]|uniref:Ribonuclease H-like domain-containing protein n=1 Tax=Favolaschia claudopus TaxID=2862362 RepID=A0AAW0AIT1_9AGAR